MLAAAVAVFAFAAPAVAQPAPSPKEAAPEQPKGAPEDAVAEEKAAPEDAKPPAKAGPTPEDIEKAKGHYIKGAELVEAEDYAGAVKEFKESYRLSRNALLLYNIGYTYDQLGDKNLALFYYEKFLKDSPGKSDNHAYAKDRARKLKREVEADAVFSGKGSDDGGDSGDSGDSGDAGKTTAQPSVDEFMHEIVEEAPPGKPLDLTAFVPDGANWQLALYFRAAGEDRFSTTLMKPRYKEMVGRIPADKMRGNTVQYYIEVKDKTGKIVARSGRANSPNIVFVDADARARYYPDFGDERGGDNTYTPARGGGGSGGATFAPTGQGYLDVGSRKYNRLKWGATAAAGGFMTTAIISYFVASNAASNIEAEAFNSNRQSDCAGGKPCFQYSDFQKDTESQGKRYQTVYRVTMGLGLVSTGVAAWLWYKEIKTKGKSERGMAIVPQLGPDSAGAAALIEF